MHPRVMVVYRQLASSNTSNMWSRYLRSPRCLQGAILGFVAQPVMAAHIEGLGHIHDFTTELKTLLMPDSMPVLLMGLVLATVGGLWAWCGYVGSRPSPACTRRAMIAILGVVTFVETVLCFAGYLHWWMVPVILAINTWGPLDAVLRFPVLHDIDTLFTVKQVSLLCGKVVAFSFGIAALLDSIQLLCILFCINFIILPLIYLVACPLEHSIEEQRRLAKGVADVDIALKFARAMSDPRKRRNTFRWALSSVVFLFNAQAPVLPMWKSAAPSASWSSLR